jgi:hypothetical protein
MGAAAETAELTQRTLKQNRYHAESDTLVFAPGEVAAYAIQKGEWSRYFSGPNPAPGLARGYISDPKELAALTSYFAWAAWAAAAQRPGKDYSYTNNFPYDPAAGNHPTAFDVSVERVESDYAAGRPGRRAVLVGRFDYLGWHGERQAQHVYDSPLLNWKITPSQRATGLYFAVVVLLFLLQVLVGGGLAHYRVEPGAFYGIDISAFLPYNLLRTYHLQLAIFWIATAWVAGASSWRHWWVARAQGPARGPLAVGRADRCGAGQYGGRVSRHQQQAGQSLVLAGAPGLGIPGPGPLLAIPAGGRIGGLAGADVPRVATGDETKGARATGLAVSLRRRGDSALLLARAVLSARAPTSRSSTTGASGSSISGSKASSSCLPQCWWL